MQALFSNLGYTYLDVRPSLELEEVGKVRGSVNIPIRHAKRKYSTEKGKKILEKYDNEDFVAQAGLPCGKLDISYLVRAAQGRKATHAFSMVW